MSAVILLQEMMLRKKLDPQSMMEDELEDANFVQNKDTNKDKVAVLAIAYHNMGVEQEFLRSYPAAILSYKKAVISLRKTQVQMMESRRIYEVSMKTLRMR